MPLAVFSRIRPGNDTLVVAAAGNQSERHGEQSRAATQDPVM
jgi:hypothetical protein